jgi:hypothetical protein
MSEQTDALNGSHHKVEEHHQQSDVLVHHLEQVIEDERQGYLAKRAIEDLGHEAQPIEHLCVTMLCAVAAASPCTTSRPRTKISAKMPPTMTIKYRNPAILACTRGDVSAIRFIIS